MCGCFPGGDVEQVVDVLKSVADLGGLIGWLEMNDEANDIEQYCSKSHPKVIAECSRRELVQRYCQGRGMHKTILDLANVLENKMNHKKQAILLRQINCMFIPRNQTNV